MRTKLLTTTAIAGVLPIVSLLNGQSPVLAQRVSVPPTRFEAQQFSRDLTRSQSQDFFVQGQNQFEREIRNLNDKRFSSSTPVLKIESMPQVGRDILPRNAR